MLGAFTGCLSNCRSVAKECREECHKNFFEPFETYTGFFDVRIGELGDGYSSLRFRTKPTPLNDPDDSSAAKFLSRLRTPAGVMCLFKFLFLLH